MANNDHPDFSLLAFTEIQDTIENEYLYSGDLYNLRLNADLVVLSACETGLGKMSRGEGILSLARGFAYAGSKSILTTLWSVNDQATAIIVEGFYKHIKAGKSKDEALQLSRLEFLEKTDNKTAHPFLWAPFIMIGDTAPIQGLDGLPNWLVYGGILGLILAGGFGFNILRNRYKLKNELV
jgi:CHAT domain-containing protein